MGVAKTHHDLGERFSQRQNDTLLDFRSAFKESFGPFLPSLSAP